VPTQRTTRPHVLSDEQRDVLRETQGAFRRATAEAVASCGKLVTSWQMRQR
jgi:hypothetical protein